MSKNDINYKCQSLGLICSFYEGGYSNIQSGNAISQNVSAGATVTKGKTISIALSKGPAKTFKVEISESQLTIGNADKTVQTLTAYFARKYPGVIFIFSIRSTNVYSNAGFIHEASQVTDGTSVTQGKTYNVIITK